jgi:4'-phosphopantetheinyl transferase
MTVNRLAPGEIHLWQASLAIAAEQAQQFAALLSADELKRAARLIAAEHQQRFIVARGILRTLLGRYLVCDPRELQFLYTEQGKPFLADTDLRFNISHSADMAVYAFTRHAEIGVDIEKVEAVFKADVAKRFFSNSEYELLTALFGEEQQRGFYRIWARKEALIKGIGEGLHIPLDSFSVTLQDIQQITFAPGNLWYVHSFTVDADFAAAFAVAQPPQKISQYRF